MCVRPVGTGSCIVVGFVFGWRASAEAVHESAGVVPVDLGRRGLLDVTEPGQRGPVRNGELSRTHSVLYRPMVVSASALS
jgi:hypothetical protein